MNSFRYTAIDMAGTLVKGEIAANDQTMAVKLIRQLKLTPVDVQHSHRRLLSVWATTRSSPSRLSARELATLTLSLASMTRAGVTIDTALLITAKTSPQHAISGLAHDLAQRIREGSSFSAALSIHERIFPSYFGPMVVSGELSGTLPDALSRLAVLIERTAVTQERIRNALIYPVILVTMITLTLIIVLTVVLPRFKSLFQDAQAEIPLATRAVIALGDQVNAYGPLVLSLTAIGIIALIIIARLPKYAHRVDRWILTSPVTFGLIAKIQTARFLRTVGSLGAGGVSLPQATGIAVGTLSNRALRHAAESVHQHLKRGGRFSSLLHDQQVFPSIAPQLARVGEESGQLFGLLTEAADTLDRETQDAIERLLSTLVPAVTVCMGIMVAIIISSVLIGILSLNNLAY